jgi:hypothetical protein
MKEPEGLDGGQDLTDGHEINNRDQGGRPRRADDQCTATVDKSCIPQCIGLL